MNRVDPDEYAIDRFELTAHGVEDIVLIDHWFRIDAGIGEHREDRPEPASICRSGAARCFIAPPQDSDAAEASCRLRHGKPLCTHDRAPARVSARAPNTHAGFSQPCGLNTRVVAAGYFASFS